jgi:hypothetical protein
MSVPRSSARIEFPLSSIDDEIKELLLEEGVQFKEGSRELLLEPEDPLPYLEVEVEDGIFFMDNSEARYGEFKELEDLLIQKSIPFDRTSRMDWDRPPERRVFRPGQPAFDHYFPLDHEAFEPVVSVVKMRELIAIVDAGEQEASAIRKYLNDLFPTYPPLADWVKEGR